MAGIGIWSANSRYVHTRDMPDLPDVTIPTTPGKAKTWPPIQWPPDVPWPDDLPWPPAGDWPPHPCNLGSCWWDFTQRFMRLVYAVGEYRMSLGLQSMLPWWDMRLCIMADPSITNTAIEWFRNMLSTIPTDGGADDITFNLNDSSWYLAAVEMVSSFYGAGVSSSRIVNANIDKMYLFGRYLVGLGLDLNTIVVSNQIQWTRGSTFIRVIFNWSETHSIRIQTYNGSSLLTTDQVIDAPAPETWYQLSVELDGTQILAKFGGAFLRVDAPSAWLASTSMQECQLYNTVRARRGPVSIDNAVARMWVDAPIYHNATTDTWTLDDTDTETVDTSGGWPKGDYTAATSTTEAAPTPFVIESGGGGVPPIPWIEPFRVSNLGQCPQLRGWLGATEIIVYGHIYG